MAVPARGRTTAETEEKRLREAREVIVELKGVPAPGHVRARYITALGMAKAAYGRAAMIPPKKDVGKVEKAIWRTSGLRQDEQGAEEGVGGGRSTAGADLGEKGSTPAHEGAGKGYEGEVGHEKP